MWAPLDDSNDLLCKENYSNGRYFFWQSKEMILWKKAQDFSGFPLWAVLGQGGHCWEAVVNCTTSATPWRKSLLKPPFIAEFQSSNQAGAFDLIPAVIIWSLLCWFNGLVDSVSCSCTVLYFLFKMYFLLLACEFSQGKLLCLCLYCLWFNFIHFLS